MLEFADAIQSNGFNCSQLEIDDRWETHYGDTDFDPVKFPDPTAMITSLRSRGLRTTLWVHPFVNIDSDALQDAVSKSVYVGDPANTRAQQRPSFTRWWQGANTIAVDMTDPTGATWYKNRSVASWRHVRASSISHRHLQPSGQCSNVERLWV